MRVIFQIFGVVSAGLFVLATTSAPARGDPLSELIERGQYVARAADCVACHTSIGGKPFAGGRSFDLPFGTLYSPNITPDVRSGIAGYSNVEWVKMLHTGVGRGGKRLYPVMPYASYTRMTDDDALAVKAYLFSLDAVEAPVIPNKISFPFNQRWGMFFWNLLNNPNERFKYDDAKSPEYNRGAYLVEALGHCGECHTPRNLSMGLNNRKALAGETQVGWLAYNLTSDKAVGLGGWSEAQLHQYLSTGRAEDKGPASGPMAEVVELSLSHLDPADIRAIVTYLRDVPAQPDGPKVVSGTPGAQAGGDVGARLFSQACAGCHLSNGEGRQSLWSGLRGSHSTGDPEGINLMQILVHGSEMKTGSGRVIMHSFTGAYTNDELATLANYTIAHFGSRAGTVTPLEIEELRLSKRPTPR